MYNKQVLKKMHSVSYCQQSHMQVLLSVTVIFSLLSAAIGAASYGYYSNPAYPGKCAYNSTLIMSPGDVIYLPYCGKMSCGSEKGDIYTVSCGVYGPPPGCSVYYPERHMNYPDCCKVGIRCDKDNQIDVDGHPSTTPVMDLKVPTTTESTVTEEETTTQPSSTKIINEETTVNEIV